MNGELGVLRTWPKSTLFWALQCCGWLFFGVAMFGWGLDYLTTVQALVSKSLLVVTGFALSLGLRVIYRAARWRRLSPAASTLLVLVVSFAGAALWREIQNILFQLYVYGSRAEPLTVHLARIPLGTLLYDGFVLLAWSLLYYAINDWIELEGQRERIARAEALAQSARLRALQSQLEPHFLFNTLNAISTLVVEGQNADAARMIARLSEFLRLTLETAPTPEIPIAEELQFVQRYLEIEQIRFGDRLHVKIDAAPAAMSALVPALVLQPLVENAVKHGVLSREQGGSVTIAIAVTDGCVRLSVADDGPGLAEGSEPTFGVGLTNIRDRLMALYGNAATFTLAPSTGKGLTAIINIPFHSLALSEGVEGTAR